MNCRDLDKISKEKKAHQWDSYCPQLLKHMAASAEAVFAFFQPIETLRICSEFDSHELERNEEASNLPHSFFLMSGVNSI